MDEEQFDKLVAAINENTRFLNILAELLATVEKRLATIEGNVHGLYRHSKAPVQPPIPGLGDDDSPMPQPGEIAKSLPRRWSNTVKVYEALWEAFHNYRFRSDDLFGEAALYEIRKATDGRIKPQTVARMMTALRRAGVAVRESRSERGLYPPTDERREAVEREADKLNAHKAKEASRA